MDPGGKQQNGETAMYLRTGPHHVLVSRFTVGREESAA